MDTHPTQKRGVNTRPTWRTESVTACPAQKTEGVSVHSTWATEGVGKPTLPGEQRAKRRAEGVNACPA